MVLWSLLQQERMTMMIIMTIIQRMEMIKILIITIVKLILITDVFDLKKSKEDKIDLDLNKKCSEKHMFAWSCWWFPTNYDNDDDGWADHSLKCKWLRGFCLNRSDGFLLNYLKVQPDHFQQIRKYKSTFWWKYYQNTSNK